MKISSLFAATVVAIGSVSASQHDVIDVENGDIDASSPLGNLIMSKARALEQNNQYTSWVSGYSIKFQQCFASSNYYGSFMGGNQNGNNNNQNNNNDRQGFNGVYEQRLVHFKLCPSSSCSSSCDNGADYVVDMNEFVNAYVESKLSVQEYNCERVRENCWCQNANNEQYCMNQCFVNAGLEYCGQYMGGGNNNNNNQNNRNGQNFDLQEALECRRLEVDEQALQYYMYKNGGMGNNAQNYYNYNQNQNNKMELFVGPYCANKGKKIVLGVFMDETCSYAAPTGTYEKLFYGNSLPYSKESLVSSKTCVACKEPDNYENRNYNDQQDADEVLEVCQRLYEGAGKCESSLSGIIPYPNTYGCDFIKKLPKVSTWSISRTSASSAKAFASLFAITTVALAALTFNLYKKSKGVNGLSQGLSPTEAELA